MSTLFSAGSSSRRIELQGKGVATTVPAQLTAVPIPFAIDTKVFWHVFVRPAGTREVLVLFVTKNRVLPCLALAAGGRRKEQYGERSK